MKPIPTTTARSNVSFLRKYTPSRRAGGRSRAVSVRAPPTRRTPEKRLWLLDHLDDVLLGVTRILLQIAYCRRIGRLALREGLDQSRLLVLHLGEMNVEDAVMGLGIERHGSARSVYADPAFERL